MPKAKALTPKQYATKIFGSAKGVENYNECCWTWRKDGGHPNAFLKRVEDTLSRLKFKHMEHTPHNSPDGNVVGSGRLYVGPGGTVNIRSSYGVVAADNHFSIKYMAKLNEKA